MFHIGSSTQARKAKAKPQAPQWFETLTAEQLVELCASCGAPGLGSKPELIARLLAGPAAEFAPTGRAGPGHTVASLREQCAKAGLRNSGDRFELVVRILRHRSGLDAGPPTKKARVARPRKEAGVPKNLSISADVDKFTVLAAGWCTVNKSGWSDKRWKAHASGVFTKASDVLEKNSDRGPAHSLAVARALLTGIAAGASDVDGWRYAEFEAGSFTDEYIKLVESSALTQEEVRCPRGGGRVRERASRFTAPHSLTYQCSFGSTLMLSGMPSRE